MRRLVRARASDLALLAELDASAGPYPWPQSALQRYLDREQVLTIEMDGVALGFLVDDIVLDETSLLHLVVGNLYQGRGHAHWALARWLGEQATSGQTRCLLEVRAGNETAIRLYHRLGFERVGVRKGYYEAVDGREDAWVMVKELTDEENYYPKR